MMVAGLVITIGLALLIFSLLEMSKLFKVDFYSRSMEDDIE